MQVLVTLLLQKLQLQQKSGTKLFTLMTEEISSVKKRPTRNSRFTWMQLFNLKEFHHSKEPSEKVGHLSGLFFYSPPKLVR